MKNITYIVLLAAVGVVLTGSVPSLSPSAHASQHAVETIAYLEKASGRFPDNFALSFYLGQLYFENGDNDAALAAWNNYVASAPKNSKTIAIKERLTVLKLDIASEFARKAAKQREPQQPKAVVKKETTAVLDFANKSDTSYTPFIKGLTAMIMTDLSKIPQLRIVERTKMSALLNEMRLEQAGIVERQTASKMGRFLLAQNIIWGSVDTPGDDQLNIASQIAETARAEEIGQVSAQGEKSQFFRLEKELVFGMLQSLGIQKKNLDPDVLESAQNIHTTSMEALTAYGQGLMFLDQRDFRQAKAAFERSMQLDPQFDMAIDAFESTPMENISVEKAVQGLRNISPPSAEEVEEVKRETAVIEDGQQTIDIYDDQQRITDTEEEEHPVGPTGPTQLLGYAVSMVDQSEPGITTFGGVYRTELIQDGSGTVTCYDILNPSNYLEFNGVTDEVTNLQIIDPIETGLPYSVQFTPIGNNSYLEWGYWLKDGAAPPMQTASFDYDINCPGYYVRGDPTLEAEMSTLASNNVTGTYTGTAFATLWNDAGGVDMTGSFSADVAFQAGTISNFNLSVTDGGTNTAGITGADGNFLNTTSDFTIDPATGSWTLMGMPADSGTADARGAVYGPNGEHMGGIFTMQYAGMAANGGFQGTRP